MPSSEKAVRPPTAVAVSFPDAASIRNCVAAPKAGAARHDQADGVAGQLRGGHREPRLGAQGDALEGDGAGEVRHLEDQRDGEPDRVERGQLREGAEDLDQAGEDEVDGDAGHHRGHAVFLAIERHGSGDSTITARSGWPGDPTSRSAGRGGEGRGRTGRRRPAGRPGAVSSSSASPTSLSTASKHAEARSSRPALGAPASWPSGTRTRPR